MSDRDEAGFHGQVKACIEETVYPPGGKFPATTEYSLDGRLLTVATLRGTARSRLLPTRTTAQEEA
jgi:hypothetical protein